MHIVVSRVVLEHHMEQVSGKAEATMVVHGLDRGEREEEDGSSWRHTGDRERQGATNCVQDKAFHWMVV